MKTMLLCSLVLVGAASASADDLLTVNDAFAGSGNVGPGFSPESSGDTFVARNGDGFHVAFTAIGQFPDGTPWAGGRIDHSHLNDDTGPPLFTSFIHHTINIYLSGGSDSAWEQPRSHS